MTSHKTGLPGSARDPYKLKKFKILQKYYKITKNIANHLKIL
jgi:hypothetical protein